MNKNLSWIFTAGLLASMGNTDAQAQGRNRNAPYNNLDPSAAHRVFRDFQREYHTEKKPERIPKDVLVVNFASASREIQNACTNAVEEPVTTQKKGFGGYAKGWVEYDIDQNGKIKNEEVLAGSWHITTAALRGIANTTFNPPVFEGRRLYCQKVRESLEWSSPAMFKWVAVRERANMSKYAELTGW